MMVHNPGTGVELNGELDVFQNSSTVPRVCRLTQVKLIRVSRLPTPRGFESHSPYLTCMYISKPQADYKGMLKTLLVRYGVKEVDFLRNAASPKLESLGVSSLIPSEDELRPDGDEKITPSPSEGGGTEPSSQVKTVSTTGISENGISTIRYVRMTAYIASRTPVNETVGISLSSHTTPRGSNPLSSTAWVV